MNATMRKFGYPDTLLKEYRHWVVLLRPQQVTAGCLVLASKSDAESLGELGAGAFAEMAAATHDLQTALKRAFDYSKINYLALMMVDPQVHFHVIPRYDGPREAAGATFDDPGWPKPPDLSRVVPLTDAQFRNLLDKLKSAWPS